MPTSPATHSVPAEVLLAAVAQIDLALREAQGPVDSLGGSLERLAGELLVLGHGEGLDPPRSAALEALRRDLSDAVRSLQFYDRMVQHLSHVHDFLADAADDLDPNASSPHPVYRWEQLRERLFRRLLSQEQRDVLHVLMPPRGCRDGAPRREGPLGPTADDVELF
ncbi:MAG: hypothetical protein RL026_1517 [Pseudomonadota bacterium]|jgi:hypothetical protein